jgi:hypothetical protein
MRSRILVGAFVLIGFAGASTLMARGASCANDKACCADMASGLCAKREGGCCMDHTKSDAISAIVGQSKQWTIVNFRDPVRVNKDFVSGPVLIVHDDQKMARGEPCTTFYRFDKKGGPKEALVSFHCKPRRTDAAETTTLKTVTIEPGLKQLVEYQIAGDSEAHGIPR